MSASTTDSVRRVRQHIVQCASEQSWKSLETPFRLGPLDQLVAPTVPIAVVYVYEAPSSSSDAIPVPRLLRAVSRLLDLYPHLTGRLHVLPNGDSSLVRLGTGAELYEAEYNQPLSAFPPTDILAARMLTFPGGGNALLAPFDKTIEGACSGPVLTIQRTRFACGSVALGVRTLHKVCDAEGFFQLVQDLATIYRGNAEADAAGVRVRVEGMGVKPPTIRPFLSEPVSSEDAESARRYKPDLFYLDEPSSSSCADDDPGGFTPTSAPFSPGPVVGRFLHFSARQLATLKAQATPPTGWISTFSALAAFLYQRIYQARLRLLSTTSSPGDVLLTDFLTPVNVRSRIDLGPRYFGNALICTFTELPSGTLASAPLAHIAQTLHNLTRTPSLTSPFEIERTLRWIAAQPDKGAIRESFKYGPGSFMISQWNKFDMYAGAEFETAPVLVSPPFTPSSLVDGLAYLLPAPFVAHGAGDEGEGIDVALALRKPVWSVLNLDLDSHV